MLKFILWTVLTLGAMGIGSNTGGADNAPQWTCTDAQWVGTPGMQGGNFVGTQEGGCTVQLGHEGNLVLLDQYFLEGVKASKTVHAGPTSETFQGLPGVMYDVTVEYDDGASVTVRADSHIATDQSTRVIYAVLSQSVRGSGMAGYIRKIDVTIEVDKGTAFGQVEVKLTNSITVDRPWYAPSGTFVAKAKEAAVAQFLRFRAQKLPGIVTNL